MLHLSNCKDGIGSYTSLRFLANRLGKKVKTLTTFIEQSGLFLFDRQQNIFQAVLLNDIYDNAPLSSPQPDDQAEILTRSDTDSGQLESKCAESVQNTRLRINRNGPVEEEKRIEKNKEIKKDSAQASSSMDFNLEKEPECVAQIFDDASLLRAVEQRVDYALWSNRRVTPFVHFSRQS